MAREEGNSRMPLWLVSVAVALIVVSLVGNCSEPPETQMAWESIVARETTRGGMGFVPLLWCAEPRPGVVCCVAPSMFTDDLECIAVPGGEE